MWVLTPGGHNRNIHVIVVVGGYLLVKGKGGTDVLACSKPEHTVVRMEEYFS